MSYTALCETQALTEAVTETITGPMKIIGKDLGLAITGFLDAFAPFTWILLLTVWVLSWVMKLTHAAITSGKLSCSLTPFGLTLEVGPATPQIADRPARASSAARPALLRVPDATPSAAAVKAPIPPRGTSASGVASSAGSAAAAAPAT